MIAWNLCTTAFYKASGRPWKLARVRPGVCYLGLVFKRDERSVDSTNACCAAQMFLDSGDGVVFKGAIGPWYSPTSKEFHLNSEAASEVVKTAVETYKAKNSTKRAPKELFIHGRISFNDEEWNGRCSPSESSLLRPQNIPQRLDAPRILCFRRDGSTIALAFASLLGARNCDPCSSRMNPKIASPFNPAQASEAKV